MGPMGRRHRLAIDGGPTIGRTSPRRVLANDGYACHDNIIPLYHISPDRCHPEKATRPKRRLFFLPRFPSLRTRGDRSVVFFLLALKFGGSNRKAHLVDGYLFGRNLNFGRKGVSYDGMSLFVSIGVGKRCWQRAQRPRVRWRYLREAWSAIGHRQLIIIIINYYGDRPSTINYHYY